MASVNKLRNERSNPAVALRNYLISELKNEKIFVYLENQDDPAFYIHHLRTLIPINISKISIHRCRNKIEVLKCFDRFSRNNSITDRTLFCVDRDHDKYINIQAERGIYTTDFYSIESEVACNDVLRMLWTCYFQNVPNRIKLETYVTRWENFLGQFVSKFAIEIFSWIILMRRDNIMFDLRKFSVKKYLTVLKDGSMSVKRFNTKKVIQSINKSFYSTINRERVKTIMREISSENPLSYIRGKQVLEVFAFYLINLITNLKNKYKRPAFRSDLEIGISNAFSVLAALTTPPESFKEYLRFKSLIA